MNALLRRLAVALVIGGGLFVSSSAAQAQVVYYGAMRPVVAAPIMAAPMVAAPAYVSNYVPAGNYAAVTAFSPPVMAAPAEVAVRTSFSPVVAAAPVAMTSYYAPAPTVSYYAPAPTVSYYAPAVTETVVASPVVAAPVTAYYAPAAVAVPLYRRGLFGAYRPVRTAYMLPY
jgi:hypothetical protein